MAKLCYNDEYLGECAMPEIRDVCDTCGGTGEVECLDCVGTGEMDCQVCHESSGCLQDGEECEECAGTGCADCEFCDGDGTCPCEDC